MADEPIPIGELTEEVIAGLLDCHRANPECDYQQEQIGYEEKARLIWVCQTHGLEGGPVRRWERDSG